MGKKQYNVNYEELQAQITALQELCDSFPTKEYIVPDFSGYTGETITWFKCYCEEVYGAQTTLKTLLESSVKYFNNLMKKIKETDEADMQTITSVISVDK